MICPSTAEIPAQIRRHFQLPTAPRGEETGSLNTTQFSDNPMDSQLTDRIGM